MSDIRGFSIAPIPTGYRLLADNAAPLGDFKTLDEAKKAMARIINRIDDTLWFSAQGQPVAAPQLNETEPAAWPKADTTKPE